MGTWNNEDGLRIKFDNTRSQVRADGEVLESPVRLLKVTLDSQALPAASDANDEVAHLPANAVITDAYLVTKTAFTGTGTISVGLADRTGSVIDADGIDADVDVDVALAAAGNVVAADGELVDKTATIGAAEAWVYATATGTVSAGVAELAILYIEV